MRRLLILVCLGAAACSSSAPEPELDTSGVPEQTAGLDGSTSMPNAPDPPVAATPPGSPDSTTMECVSATDLDEIVALLQTGQPTYDYQPAKDLAELGRWAGLAMTGTVDAAVRASRTGTAATTFTVSDVEVFAGIGDVEEFESASLWAAGQGPDPLAETVTFSGLRFVGFFGDSSGGAPRWVPYVDGLVFGCDSDNSALLPLGVAPPQSDGEPFNDFVEIARSAAMNVEGGAIDGPVMRHPVRPVSGVGLAALIEGPIELDGDCLYLAPTEGGERYPILWPADTSWDAERMTVVLATGVPVPIGGAVRGGGGYFDVEMINRLAGQDAADQAARCIDNQFGEIAVVNNLETAIEPG